MKISIEIEGSFGSDFQEEAGITMLELLIRSWLDHHNKSHKRTDLWATGSIDNNGVGRLLHL